MKGTFSCPADPLARFRDLFAALEARRGWFEGDSPLRFAALTLATTKGSADTLAADVRECAARIAKASRWWSPLTGDLRFLISAILLRDGDTAEEFVRDVARVQALFRRHRMRRGEGYEAIAVLLLRPHCRPITDQHVLAIKALYEEMKRHHWWLTGPEDYAYCAVFALRRESPAAVGNRVEEFYSLLRAAGCAPGDQLQRVSHILYLNPRAPHEVIGRFVELRARFRSARIRIDAADWDELAMLTFPEQSLSEVVRETVAARDALLEHKPSPGRALAFSLGASIAFLKLHGGKHTFTDAKSLGDLQEIIAAQQAAAAAACG
ncbi:MAG: DUF4003 family protein [Planctomycetes bacterium]|nr:DUF4003 family protein [Planctomycetota bacterium]